MILPVWFSALIGALLFIAPAVNLLWRGGTGYCFFVLLILSLGMGVFNRKNKQYFAPLFKYGWYTVGMSIFIIAIAIQQLLYHYWLPRQLDALSRFALGLPIFLLLCRIPSRHLRLIGLGCVTGAIIVFAHAFINRPNTGWSDGFRLGNYFTNQIPFGDIALLLAFLSIFTYGWAERQCSQCNLNALGVRLLALLTGVFTSYLSGSRGGWLAIPAFLLLLSSQYHWFRRNKKWLVFTVLLTVGVSSLFSIGRIHDRFSQMTSDLIKFRQGNENTDTGFRLQLWDASLHIFRKHPVYGVGKGYLEKTLSEMAQKGEANPAIVNERAHSDFFSTLAEMGTVGIVCLGLFYFGLSIYFLRNRNSTDPTIRTASYAGLAVASSTIIYGLTIDVLVPVMQTTLIALLSLTLLAIIEVRRQELST